MTWEQKDNLLSLEKSGLGYRRISVITGINENTVKSFLRAHGLKSESRSIRKCKNCGVPISIIPGHRPRRYCSDACRMAWWKENRDQLNRKAWYDLVCHYCGKKFKSYGDAKQKYCCRECYDRSRRSVHQ